MKVMHDMGENNNVIGEAMGRSKHTVKKYLQIADYSDPVMVDLVEKIKAEEERDLTLICAKARARVNDLLDEGNVSVIPAVAIADRFFNQRMILQSQSSHPSARDLVGHCQESIKELEELKRELVEQLDVMPEEEESPTSEIDVTPQQEGD